MNKLLSTGELYGSLSHGNHYDDFFTNKEIINRKNVVKTDLNLAGISINNLKNYTCMNVGTGRESLALSQLGAKHVDHYDISSEHIMRFAKLKKKKFIKNSIKSLNVDLCRFKLPKNKYDFVYLNGIVHHFSDVGKGLLNCANSVKLNGYIWLYFYRSGTFKWFVCQMIRELINKNDFHNFFRNISNIYASGDTKNLIVSRIMDDFYAPFIHLYSLKNYESFMKNLGFVKHKYINSHSKKDIDHKNLHHSAIIVFKKNNDSMQRNSHYASLKPDNSINQIDKKLYKNKEILKSINTFKKILKNKDNKKKQNDIFSCVLALHKISAKQYYGGSELPPNYKELNRVLDNTLLNILN